MMASFSYKTATWLLGGGGTTTEHTGFSDPEIALRFKVWRLVFFPDGNFLNR